MATPLNVVHHVVLPQMQLAIYSLLLGLKRAEEKEVRKGQKWDCGVLINTGALGGSVEL